VAVLEVTDIVYIPIVHLLDKYSKTPQKTCVFSSNTRRISHFL